MEAIYIELEPEYNIFSQLDTGTREVGKPTAAQFTIKSDVPLPSSAFITVDMPK
jgi:hypothetical protein